MPQYGRPNSTVTAGSWSAQGGPSTLWECIDETTFSDTDFIRSSGTTSNGEVGLTALDTPANRDNHIIRFRMRAAGTGGPENLQVALIEGTTVIATSGNNTNRSGTFAEQTFTLSNAQASTITNYGDLRIRVIPSHGGSETIDISWAEFEIPDASSATDHEQSASDTSTFSDAATAQVTKAASDAIAFTDQPDKQITKAASDSLVFSDELAFEKTMERTASDTATFTDDVTFIRTVAIELNDGVSLSDALTRQAQVQYSDTLSLADDATTQIIIDLQLNDSVSLTDAHTKAFTQSHSDALTLADDPAVTVSITYNDTVAFADDNTREIVILLALNDGISVSDGIGGSVIGKNLSESLVLNDQQNKLIGLPVGDGVGFAEEATSQIVVLLNLNDEISISDSTTLGATLVQSDSLNLTDERIHAIGIAKSDELTLGDSAETSISDGSDPVAHTQAINDSISLSDSAIVAIVVDGITSTVLATVSLVESTTQAPAQTIINTPQSQSSILSNTKL